MQKFLRVACIQLQAGSDWKVNLNRARYLAAKALKQGAQVISFPEHFVYLGTGYAQVAALISGQVLPAFRLFAKENKVSLILGSIPEPSPKSGKAYNATFVINEKGRVIGHYRKQKLFHADLASIQGASFSESRDFLPGNRQELVSLAGFNMGIGICFDLRFPEIFAAYRRKRVDIIWLPSAFAYQTGKAHWETLVRARAIESQCYVVAPNQYGKSVTGSRYFGHSLIVDPWGKVLCVEKKDRDSVLIADISKEEIRRVRQIVCMDTF